MLELLPLVPLFARHSVGIVVFAYDGGVEHSFAELKQLACASRVVHRGGV